MKKNIYLLLLCALFGASFIACNLKKGFELKGALKNAANIEAVLERAEFTNVEPVAVAKATADANGNFILKLEEGAKTGIYRLKVGAKMIFFVLNDSEKEVKLDGDIAPPFDFKVTGSVGTDTYFKTLGGLTNQKIDLAAAKAEISTCPQPLAAALLSLQILGSDYLNTLPQMKEVGEKLTKSMPGSSYAKDYAEILSKMQAQVNAQPAAKASIAIGSMAPDISLDGLDGKKHTLSDLKGKIVLLDFWASWCGPCRRENPRVVEVYKKYKDRGFTVFSVSLDGVDARTAASFPDEMLNQQIESSRQLWKEAVKKDGLVWEHHVSDLKKWDCVPAVAYGVQSIPSTFLIGKDGKVVAINPRERLEEELKKLL